MQAGSTCRVIAREHLFSHHDLHSAKRPLPLRAHVATTMPEMPVCCEQQCSKGCHCCDHMHAIMKL